MFEDFAEALINPIAYQSNLEKHTKQLAVLEEDFDVDVSARALLLLRSLLIYFRTLKITCMLLKCSMFELHKYTGNVS